MIKMLSAFTTELDDPEKAVQDILEQADFKNSLLKNSAAMLFCHSQFIEMGVMEAVCKNLPCDVLGCTSMNFATNAQSGQFVLNLTILTSDDVEFATGVSEPLTAENAEKNISDLCQKTAASFNGTPALAFAFPPTLFEVTIDIMEEALNRACKEIPVFGTVALDVGVKIRKPQVIYQGAAYGDRVAMLLFKGSVKPRFFFQRFPERSFATEDAAVITQADGPHLITINNEPAALFLRELGLIQDSSSNFVQAMPLVIGDGEGNNPEVVVVQNITPEGVLVCGKHIQAGGILNIGAMTKDHVLESAKTLIQYMKEGANGSEPHTGLFIFSCFLRTIVLGGAAEEIELIRRELESYPYPWVYINSAGELCPNLLDAGAGNQALQFAIISCQL